VNGHVVDNVILPCSVRPVDMNSHGEETCTMQHGFLPEIRLFAGNRNSHIPLSDVPYCR
jgi:hypothetical protein